MQVCVKCGYELHGESIVDQETGHDKHVICPPSGPFLILLWIGLTTLLAQL